MNNSKLSRTRSADLVREPKDSLASKDFMTNLDAEDSDNKVASRTHLAISLKNSRSFLAETKDLEVVVDNRLHKGVKT
jgi:hypothetical protein